MKTKKLIIAIVLMLNIAGIQAQNSMFNRLSENKDVTTVHVSKAMLGMIPSMDLNGINIKNLVDKLEQIEIYTTSNNEAMSMMRSESKSVPRDKSYETLMTVKEEGENISFYAKKENDMFKDLIMFVDESSECVIIRIIGTFTAEDLQRIMDKSNVMKE